MDLGNNANSVINVTGGSLMHQYGMGRTALSFTAQPATGSTVSGLYVNGPTRM